MLPDNIPVTSSYVRQMMHKYHCIRPILTINVNPTYKLADKKDTIFSSFHNTYILKKESIFIKSIKSYTVKEVYKFPEFREKIKLLKIKRLYINKLISVKPEGINYLQEQFSLLPGKIGLSSIRPSRSFMVKANSITPTYIMLKGIPVPIKYIKIIKNKNNGQN